MDRAAPARVMLTTDSVGGVWRYCLDLATGFVARGAAVTVVVMGPPANDAQRAEARICGVDLVETALPLDWLAEDAGALEQAARALAGLARELGADSVQVHSPAYATGADWNVPVVAMAHSCVGTWWRAVRGDLPLPPDLAWRVDCVAHGMHAADAVIAPSAAFAAMLHETYGDGHAIIAIPNGRRTAPLPRDAQPHAFTAGRLWDDAKNVALLDEAAAMLEQPVRAAGPLRGPNGAQIDCRRLHLLGVLDDVQLACEYAQASVFVSPARYEPFGLAVLEAAQAGAALVLSDIPTFRDLWDGAAMFVDPNDPAALALLLRRLLPSRRRCSALGVAARARAATYSAERMAAETWDVHCNLWRARETRARCAA
ncbi:MAG TPA: glycosyltransferase family 4 protein [Acetobacteraceae bacterium]|nr:glycosyltransferase family 4 protein [Acetobacteraceae bacterium]